MGFSRWKFARGSKLRLTPGDKPGGPSLNKTPVAYD